MSRTRKTLGIIVLVAIAVCLVQVFFDLPITRRLFPGWKSGDEPLAARVAGHPITHSQLDRAVSEQLWLQGKSIASAAPEELELARKAALAALIDHYLLRLEVKASTPVPVTDEEIRERVQRLVGRFESKGELETAMKSQGIANDDNLRARLTARIQQEKHIALQIAPAIRITDDESRKWFEENKGSVSLPERIEVRHIFLPALDHPPEESKLKLDAALALLNEKKKDFASLAKELSEDPATKDQGGALGWMSPGRLPVDFEAPVFSLPINQPALVRTRLGWHLVEVTGRKPAEPRTYELAKPEITAALETVKRQQATADYLKSLRQKYAAKIEIFGQETPRSRNNP